MILTGPILKQRCQEIRGDWRNTFALYLGINRITVWRWGKKKTGHTRGVKIKLLTALDEQMRITAALIDELRDDIGQM